MKQGLNILLFTYMIINLVHCQQSSGSMATTQLSLIDGDDDQCPLWRFFNTTTQQCECYTSPSTSDIVECTEQGIKLRVGYCMTYEELEGTIYTARCNYFDGNHFTTKDNGRYVELPIKNVSELNSYMCEPMNRKGRVCSECVDGFGPSIISFGLPCSNCTNAWYGVPLYLFLEFVPITVFYVIILLFRVNITSSPMVAYTFFSQVVVGSFHTYGIYFKFVNHTAYTFFRVLITFYGFWNLDFFRHILPPFCVSPELKNMHIVVIDYISALYPLCLICITWIIIQLHFRDFKPVVWLWSKCSCTCVRDRNHNHSNSLIDVFTTFFLLSFSKLVTTSSKILSPRNAKVYMNNSLSNVHQLAEDPRIEYFGKEHLLYALISISIIQLIILPPLLLLILYPIKVFRLLFFKCRFSTRTIASLNIFVEKYYSCYRDGTDGGKDMRSLASMYFIIRVIAIAIFQSTSLSTSLVLVAVLYGSYGIVVALVRPYKKNYMNIIDTLLMENLALLPLMVERYYQEESFALTLLYAMTICTFTLLPLLSLTGFIAYRIFKRFKSEFFHTKKHTVNHQSSNELTTVTALIQRDPNDDDDPEVPDRVLHPNLYNFV